jgi:hypothetical protein
MAVPKIKVDPGLPKKIPFPHFGKCPAAQRCKTIYWSFLSLLHKKNGNRVILEENPVAGSTKTYLPSLQYTLQN